MKFEGQWIDAGMIPEPIEISTPVSAATPEPVSAAPCTDTIANGDIEHHEQETTLTSPDTRRNEAAAAPVGVKISRDEQETTLTRPATGHTKAAAAPGDVKVSSKALDEVYDRHRTSGTASGDGSAHDRHQTEAGKLKGVRVKCVMCHAWACLKYCLHAPRSGQLFWLQTRPPSIC